MSNWDQFQQKYNEAPADVKAFIDSEKIPDFASKLRQELPLKKTTTPELISALTDIALGFRKSGELAAELQKKDSVADVELAERIAAFIEKRVDLAPLPEANPDLKERLHLRPEGVAAKDPNTPKPLTREELMNSLTAKRTMAGDIAAVQKRTAASEPPPQPKETLQPEAAPTKKKSSIPWYKKPLIDDKGE